MLSYTVFRMNKTYFSYIPKPENPLLSNTDILFIPQFAFECVCRMLPVWWLLYRKYAGTSYLDDIFGFVRWLFCDDILFAEVMFRLIILSRLIVVIGYT
jgi:hypothetical protein